MQEVVQRLPIRSGHDGPQFDERLVVFARQQEPDEMLPQGLAFFVAPEQVVERGAELVDRLRRRQRGFAGGRHGIALLCGRQPQTRAKLHLPTTAGSMPHLTNQR
jgi:hypothetical protein